MIKQKIILLFLFVLIFINGLFAQYKATGNYRIIEKGEENAPYSLIVDDLGNEFVAKGSNVWGIGQVWPSQSRNIMADVEKTAYIDTWKFNALRVVNRPSIEINTNPFQTVEDLDAIAEYYSIIHNLVVVFTWSEAQGKYPTLSQVDEAKDFFSALLKQPHIKNNSRIWFNPYTETGGSDESNKTDANREKWVNQFRDIIKSIRDEEEANAMVKHIICIGGWAWSQDQYYDNREKYEAEESVVSTYGHQVYAFSENGKEYSGNIIFDLHAYGNWDPDNQDDADRKLGSYIDELREKGFPLIIGEYGEDTKIPDHLKAAIAVHHAGVPRNVSRFQWSWSNQDHFDLVNGGNTPWSGLNFTNDEPNNLTTVGRLVWDDNRASIIPGAPKTSMNLENKNRIKVYPNPMSANEIWLDAEAFCGKGNIMVTIHNGVGEAIYSGAYANAEQTIKISNKNFSKGLYFITIRCENEVFTDKITKI